MTARSIRIVIADDQTIFRNGLRLLLESDPALQVVAEASEPIAAVELVRQHRPDLLLLDLTMPNGGGLGALRELARDPVPVTRTVILTAAIDRSEQMIAIQLGARGILTKDVSTELLLKCVHCVSAGQYWLGHQTVSDLVDATVLKPADHRPARATLTSRERDIVAAIVDGNPSDGTMASAQTVNDTFDGFYAPVDKLPIVNSAKAGQAIPTKWRLTDLNGTGVSDPSSFVGLTSVPCSVSGSEPVDEMTEYAAGSSGLQYLGNGNWQYNWKTPKEFALQCRIARVTLLDGSVHEFKVQFKK